MVEAVRRRLRKGHARRGHEETMLFVPLTIAAWPEGDLWVSQVLELDISSVGSDADDAFEQAKDAVCSYLNTIEELGEREQVFAERSIAVYTSPPASVRLADVPRDVAEREHVQVRPANFPVSEHAFA